MWQLSKDLQNFRQLTRTHIVVMGRKTFDSLPNGPLSNRINVIITREPTDYNQYMKDVYFTTLKKSLLLLMDLQKYYNKSIFIIGGTKIYKYFYPHCYMLHITKVDNNDEGDTYFPISDMQINENYVMTYNESNYDESENIKYSFCRYQKIQINK